MARNPIVGLSDPSILRSTEAQLAQASIIANGKPTVAGSELILPNTTVATTSNTVVATTSANNDPGDIVTVYSSNQGVYVSSIDQTIRQTIVNNPIAGVSGIIAGNNVTITSTGANGTGNVTINATASNVGNIAVINLDGNASNVLHGDGTWSADQTTYGNSNVAAYLPTYTGNIGGNVVTANLFAGNGSSLHHLAGANVTGFVPNANVANTAFAVAAANVSGLGNIATINLTGSTSNVLYGNGVFAAVAASTGIANGTSSVTVPVSDGNVLVQAGTDIWTFDNTGNLELPLNGNINANGGGITQTINEDLTIVVQDEEDDGWSLYNTITDGIGNNLSQTQLDSSSFTIRTDMTGASYRWQFDGNTMQVSNNSTIRGFDSNVVLQSMYSGTSGTASLQSVSNQNDPNIFSTFDATTTGANIKVYNGGSSGGTEYAWQFDNTGNLTLPNDSILTFGDTPVTNRYYIDATRTDTYTQNGSQARPFKTIAGAQAAIATAISGGLNPEVEPIYMILLSNITEDVTLATNHVYLVGQNGQIHQPIILSGNVTVNPTSGTLGSNHFSISGLEIVGGTNGKAIFVTGTSPLRLSLQDVWITANGTGAGLYQDNSGVGTYTHGGPIKVSHNGTGDVYCFDIRSGTASFDTVETSGATQVGAAGPGATLTFNNSQLDANGDVVVETYGSGVLVVTNSVIKNSQANGFGVKLNAVANVAGTVSLGQSAMNVPTGTGSAVWLDPNTTAGLSGVFAYAGVSFYPSTNTTISPTLIPGPLLTLVGTQVSPIFYGDITSYGVAQDWDLIDNNSSALSFDTTGKAGIINLVTTNGSEGVTMSGYTSVTGNVTGGNLLTAGIVKTGSFVTGTIPSAATAGAGARAFVTDATLATFGSAYVGGAATAVPVWSDGSAWYIG